jgi:glycosidase
MRIAMIVLAGCAAPSLEDSLMSRPHQSNEGVDWRDQVIYQVMVDRFANGDPNNDFGVEPGALARHHGGDWQGLIDRLDYIEDLGATALWISPVVKNVEEDAGFSGYHGYWTLDPVRPNPHFGDLVTLRELVDEAHRRGILVILDVVTNHVGQLFYYDINGNGQHDDFLSGGGTSHTCVQVCNPDPSRCTDDEKLYCQKGGEYFERIIEADPEYDPRGIRGWTSLGFSGPADIQFYDNPAHNRGAPPRPHRWIDWPDDKPWFDDPTWYNRHGRVYLWWHEGDGYSGDFIREQETLGDFPGGLKDLDTDHPDVIDALSKSFEFWISAADVDGLRIDTLKHVDRPEVFPNRRGFWGAFTDRMRAHAQSLGKQRFFMFGEAFDGNDALIGSYTFGGEDERGKFGRVDSVFYFSQKYRVFEGVFAKGGATKHIECLHASRFGLPQDPWCAANGYPEGPTHGTEPHAGGAGAPPSELAVSFLDNHDLPRFFGEHGSPEILHNALFFLLTWDGVPCLYYGTEQRFSGGNDPRNREDMAVGNLDLGYPPFDTTNDTYAYVRDLIAIRKAYPALRRGPVSVRWSTDRAGAEVDAGIFAFERSEEETVLVVLNTNGSTISRTCAPDGICMSTTFRAGAVLEDVAPGSDGARFTVSEGGTLDVPVPPRGGRILVPALP